MGLKLGKMRSEELAEFFEVSYDWYRKQKKDKYLPLLKQYATYEEVYGGVNIIEIKKEEYIPEQLPLKEIFLRELKNFPESNYYKDQVYGTLIQMAYNTLEEVQQLQKQKKMRVWTSAKTLANKYGEISKELYGSILFNRKLYKRGGIYTPKQIKEGRGPLGFRFSCMLIKEGEGYRELTEEEQKIYKEINDNYDREHQEEIREELSAYREAAYAKKMDGCQESQDTLSAIEDKWAKDFDIIRKRFMDRAKVVLVPRGTAWWEKEQLEWALPVQ